MGFWVKYLATAILGTVLVYYGAPRIKPSLPSVVQAMRRPTEMRHAPIRPVSVPAAPVPVAAPSEAPVRLPDSEADTPPDSDRSAGQPSAPHAAVVVSEPGYLPSTQRIRPSDGTTTHWGVTVVEASVYEMDGKRRPQPLPGGTLIEQTGTTTSSRGEMAICRIWNGAGWDGPGLVAAADLIRFAGGRDTVDADALATLQRYYTLNARLEKRRQELVRRAVDANPHAAELRRLKQAYDAAAKRAEALTQQRDEQNNAERIRIGDELRRLKESERSMRKQIEGVTTRYEAWKQANGGAAVDASRDPQMQALASQMKELLPRLKDFEL